MLKLHHRYTIEELKSSQKFLKERKLVEVLLDKSSINKKDIVYEIGPGKGIITECLAKRCKKVTAIELDKKLYERLKSRFRGNTSIEIKFGDFLQYQLPRKQKYKIFSNIPFNLTADIVRKLTLDGTFLLEAFLIVQKEAAERFTGFPYSKETQISLLLKPKFDLKILHNFRKSDFEPKPRVDVVLLGITRRKEFLVRENQKQMYRDFIVYGFSQWKESLRKAFKKIFTYRQFIRLAGDLNFSKEAKPADLSFEQWMGLFRYFLKGVDVSKKFDVIGAETDKQVQVANSSLRKGYKRESAREYNI